MQHLCKLPLRDRQTFILLLPTCQGQVRFFALIELSHILHRLCRPPSISLSFNLATVLPRRHTYRVSYATKGVDSSHGKCAPFTARTTRVSNPVCSPSFRASVSRIVETRFRHRCSSRYLRISPLHREFQSPLRPSSKAVFNAVSGLSPEISHQTCPATYAPFTPSESEQRLGPLYYRGCWHRVSRPFLFRYYLLLIY